MQRKVNEIRNNIFGTNEILLYWKDRVAVCFIQTGKFVVRGIYVKDWKYPVGAFHGVERKGNRVRLERERR